VTPALAILAYGAMAGVLFCTARAVSDMRARRFVWGTAGLAVALILASGLMTPVKTHAVKIDLPAAD